MRDAGLSRAIDAAGGVAQLARKVGIAQPSVSNWSRVPAERVIAVETATGVSRAELRPDLYDESATPENTVVDPVDAARGREYGLLAALLSSSPPQALLDQIARLSDDATPLGRAHWALAEAASSAVASDVEREYFDLFVGLGRGELLPYASYYLTGFLNERPLSRLREDLVALDIERVESNFEPEDHAATLCEIMAGLATGRFPASPGMQAIFFAKHVAPWMSRMFADLEGAASARFYRSVGSLGRLFLEIETEAFTFAN
ncbi:molecular chaperone [Bradyrhizobium sp. KBS0727]|uniref:molecular chaperone TorD family protein n=1 Tax=unclassified Bradyrhizobium TaxID=2631580 RepID=UPI00110D2AAF|nr:MULTISPECIES: molecular chaperone TorD family protein [unclassified Bradyrhizobium]QDW37979.1 molecular chaperone [Bradyrhizobium sp. KBS0725]QDW44583.1 molecular chaperone [Bradyrhizobium sp. KBS0727]